MTKRRRQSLHPSSLIPHPLAAAIVAAVLALAPSVALAQEAGGTSDRDRVMIWTAVVSIIALVACAIGYAYRRMRGMDHPTPDELEMMGHDGHHDESAAEAHDDHAVHPHAEAEHDSPVAARH
jgi:H+/gluconate symporter-like permease